MKCNWNRHLQASQVLAAFAVFSMLVLGGCSGDGKNGGAKITSVEEQYPGLSMGLLKNAKLAKLKPDILAEAGGAQITSAQLQSMTAEMPPEILSQIKKNLVFLLEQRLILTVLVQEAKAAGIQTEGASDGDIIQALLMHVAKNASVSEEDIKTFYDANKAMIGDTPFDEAKETIQVMLLQQKQQEAVNTYFKQLEQRAEIRVNREWLEEHGRLARDNAVDKARLSGKPSMIEFDIAASPAREIMAPMLENLGEKYPEGLNLVFINVEEEQVLGARYGIREVPTQLFFDRSGKEASRHSGMFSEGELAEQLAKIGIN